MVNDQEYNTYLLKLNLDNIENNYNRLINNVNFLLLDSDNAIIEQLKHDYIYHDKIDFNNLDIDDVKEYLKDFKQEYIGY